MHGNTIGILISLFCINLIIVVISMWFVFKKANRPGWGVFIPIYNIYLFVKISGKPGWWTVSYILWGILPVLQIFGIIGLTIASSISLAKRFNKSTLFGWGLVFLSFIFWPILAFSNAKYSNITPEDVQQDKHVPPQDNYRPAQEIPKPPQKNMNYPSFQRSVYERFAQQPLPHEQQQRPQQRPQQSSNQQSLRQPPVFKQPSHEKPFERGLFDLPKMNIPVPQKPISKQPFTKQPESKQPKREQPNIIRPQVERPFDRMVRERPLVERPIMQRPIIERPLMEEPEKKNRKNEQWSKDQKPGNNSGKKSKWDRLL